MSVHFSSAKHDWTTPVDLFHRLDRVYQFDLDVASSEENALCKRFFTEADNGIAQSWADSRVWCNPPYGRSIGVWTRKAAQEAERAVLIVMLVPARTDTSWWHDAVKTARVEYIKGRLKFGNSKNSAPFPSALLYWNC